MGQTAFSERYRKWCKRRGYNFSSDKAVKIYGKAQDQIAMMHKEALTRLLVKQAVDALNAVSATLERLKAETLQMASQLPEFPVVMAMRGVGDSLVLIPEPTSPVLTRLKASAPPKAVHPNFAESCSS